MEIRIEKATIDNLNDIIKLNHKLCIHEYENFDKTINKNFANSKAGKDYFKDRINNENSCALVAFINGKIVGYLMGAIVVSEHYIDYRNINNLAEVENIIVNENYQNKGIGKQLIDGFLNWCKQKNVQRVKAVASAKNKVSMNFMRKQGFLDYEIVLEKNP